MISTLSVRGEAISMRWTVDILIDEHLNLGMSCYIVVLHFECCAYHVHLVLFVCLSCVIVVKQPYYYKQSAILVSCHVQLAGKFIPSVCYMMKPSTSITILSPSWSITLLYDEATHQHHHAVSITMLSPSWSCLFTCSCSMFTDRKSLSPRVFFNE